MDNSTPKKYKNRKRNMEDLHLWLPKELLKKIRKRASDDLISVTAQSRKIFEQFFEAEKK